jgi:hypothetical protein
MRSLSPLTASLAAITGLTFTGTDALPVPSGDLTAMVTAFTGGNSPSSHCSSVASTRDSRHSIYSNGGASADHLRKLTVELSEPEQDDNAAKQARYCRQVYQDFLRGVYASPTTVPELPAGLTLTDLLRQCVRILPPEEEANSVKLKAKLKEFLDSSNESTPDDKNQGWGAGASIAAGIVGLGAAAICLTDGGQRVVDSGQQALKVGGKVTGAALKFIVDAVKNANLQTAECDEWEESDSE